MEKKETELRARIARKRFYWFLISPLISIYMLFRKKYKLGFLYLFACLVNIPLLFLSLRVVGWLIIVD